MVEFVQKLESIRGMGIFNKGSVHGVRIYGDIFWLKDFQ